jgi:hypothetical protein
MKALIAVMSAPYPTEANIDNDNYTNNYGTLNERESTAGKEFNFHGDRGIHIYMYIYVYIYVYM